MDDDDDDDNELNNVVVVVKITNRIVVSLGKLSNCKLNNCYRKSYLPIDPLHIT